MYLGAALQVRGSLVVQYPLSRITITKQCCSSTRNTVLHDKLSEAQYVETFPVGKCNKVSDEQHCHNDVHPMTGMDRANT
jgi:hypothetical protein